MKKSDNVFSKAKWIGIPEPTAGRVLSFSKTFRLKKYPETAELFCAGIGYCKPYLNEIPLTEEGFSPAFSDYSKTVYYERIPIEDGMLWLGNNTMTFLVAEGWRNAYTDMMRGAIGDRKLTFAGPSQLLVCLKLTFDDGSERLIVTDEDWKASFDWIVKSSIFDGETLDNSIDEPQKASCVLLPSPGGELVEDRLPPIRMTGVYPVVDLIPIEKGRYIADFGYNIAGNVSIRIPAGMKKGERIILRFSEELNEDGNLYTAPLRDAKCTDTYIASGLESGLDAWQPVFTFHGFRYCEITSPKTVSKDDLYAYTIHTDLRNRSFFSCGSALINKLQENIVRTEENNMFSILTDCPQRDERMGWMNDATVRFEETPYNFDISKIFPKIIRDIRDCQEGDGSITCTAPYYFGMRPADPVCSSFLVAGYETWLHTGDTDVLKANLDAFAAWEDCLLEHSTDYLVDYSYYGDWAAPEYACIAPENAVNAATDGKLVSTAFSYWNCVLLKEMAEAVGRRDIQEKYQVLAEKIGDAFRKKWYHSDTCTVGDGSQGAQAFGLRFGLIPSSDRKKAAKVMKDDLVKRKLWFTTGNLATVYMLDMLMEYGYIDTAWDFLTKEEYPSYGYTIQQEATTVWERFELKKDPGMNSHDHPMYGSVGKLFYSRICGIVPTEPGYSRVSIKPVLPQKLMSAHCVVDTVKGEISVRWMKRYGKRILFVCIPETVIADIDFCGKKLTCSGGFHVIETEDE